MNFGQFDEIRADVKDRRVRRKPEKVRWTFSPTNACQGGQAGISYREV